MPEGGEAVEADDRVGGRTESHLIDRTTDGLIKIRDAGGGGGGGGGGEFRAGAVERPVRLFRLLPRLRRRPGERLEVPLPLLQARRRRIFGELQKWKTPLKGEA